MTKVGTASNLEVHLVHIVCLAIGRFRAKRTFLDCHMSMCDSAVRCRNTVLAALIDNLFPSDVQFVVLGYKDFVTDLLVLLIMLLLVMMVVFES